MTELASVAVERQGRTAVARLAGEVDLSNAAAVEDTVAGELTGARAVALDLAGLRYLDSAGLALLSRLATRCDETGTAIRLVVPPGAIVRRAIEVSGLDTVIPVDESVEAALATLDT